MRLNEALGDNAEVEVVLLSRNSADTGLRVFNSIQHHNLTISRAAFCGGESPWRYINAFGCQLFLSNEADDVRHALDHGGRGLRRDAVVLLPAPAEGLF